MKALTVHQPWASLIVLGIKHFETRSWRTNHRGVLAIHAAKTVTERDREIAWTDPVYTLLQAEGLTPRDLPTGRVLGTALLWYTVPTQLAGDNVNELERRLGNWSPGRHAWKLSVEEVFPEGYPVRGQQGLWDWTQEDGAERPDVAASRGPDA